MLLWLCRSVHYWFRRIRKLFVFCNGHLVFALAPLYVKTEKSSLSSSFWWSLNLHFVHSLNEWPFLLVVPDTSYPLHFPSTQPTSQRTPRSFTSVIIERVRPFANYDYDTSGSWFIPFDLLFASSSFSLSSAAENFKLARTYDRETVHACTTFEVSQTLMHFLINTFGLIPTVS